ncbi:MAG: type IX secretion system membrane protein PorP/SprF [Bacteroidia bacterium]|nr:type IX secretion system membrane protein PorP/SprF [Bacteroidia bacterium]
MKHCIIICFLIGFMRSLNAQQDPQFSLYQFNQLAVNPAYAGARDGIAVVADMRKQWVSFPGAPTTLAFTAHAPVWNNKLGLGVNVLSDQIGAKSTTGVYGNVAYILKLNNRLKLSFGLRAGYINYRFNFNKVIYKDLNEGSAAGFSTINRSAADIDAGLYLRGNSFFVGISSTHLNGARLYNKDYTVTALSGQTQNLNASYALVPHVFLTAGKAFSLNENLVFSPSVMVRSVKTTVSGDLNLNFLIHKRLWLGAFIKQNYGAGALVQIYATEKLRIGYTYDAAVGSKKLLGSSHEIMIGFDFGNYKTKILSPRFL